MSTPTIRRMGHDEVEEVARLLVLCNQEHLSKFPPEVAAAYRDELADVAGRLPFSHVLLAEHLGELVGTVTYLPDAADDGHEWPPGGAVLRLLAVDPRARRAGIGRALARRCIELARSSGARFLALHTAPFMVAALRLYEELGFERTPEQDFHPGFYYGEAPMAGTEPAWGWAYVLKLE